MEKETIDWQLNCTQNVEVKVDTKNLLFVVKGGKMWYARLMSNDKGIYFDLTPHPITGTIFIEKNDFFINKAKERIEGWSELGWCEYVEKTEVKIQKIQSFK